MGINHAHGGDWAGYKKEYGQEPLDFSINVNPLGTPDSVVEAIKEAAGEVDRYPDPYCRELRQAISDAEEIPIEQILCGNGAADLIGRIVQAVKPAKGLVTAPCFSEYPEAMDACGVPYDHIYLKADKDFSLQDDFPEQIGNDIDMVFLCQPNNPTGITTSVNLLDQILARCTEIGAILVLDECFTDLLDEPEKHTMKSRLADYPNLVILKAFTKTYAIPGVRLGYCLCSDLQLLRKIAACGQAWEVSHLAQKAGIAALKEQEYVRRARAMIAENREWMKTKLQTLGYHVIPGEANYLLFTGPKDLDKALRKEGILIRNCQNYEGLPCEEYWYRVAIRRKEENSQLMNAISALKKHSRIRNGNIFH